MGHGRPRWAAIFLAAWTLCWGLDLPVGAEPEHLADELLQDADLADIFFLDPDRGWAVGDRGAIWHTEDGGRHWRLQVSPVACRLESVHFLNDRYGWIVGGWIQPYTHQTIGVVLRTENGGETWQRIPNLSMPGLKRVRFFDGRNGWALGSASATYPAGVFQTADGGRSWASIPCQAKQHWTTGDFRERGIAVLGGRDGAVALAGGSGVQPAGKPNMGIRHVRCVRLPRSAADLDSSRVGSGQGVATPSWLVGDGGLVLASDDGGQTWRLPRTPLPGGMYDYFDFYGVANVDQHCWIVGAPGSMVLSTADGGQSWRAFPTGQSLPLRTVTFLDEYRGWAAGALGVILATRDGGQTWFAQRQGGSRAAMLALFSSPERLPMEMLAQQAGNEGYLTAVEILTRPYPQVDAATTTSSAARTMDAVTTAGASWAGFAWGFPAPDPQDGISAEALMDQWTRYHQTDARLMWEEYLVRKIRQWRPSIVVTEPASPRGEHPVAHLVNQAVLTAVEQAASEAAYVDHLSQAGLEPWQVKRVYAFAGADQPGSLNLTTAQIAPRLGRSLTDQADHAWRLLRDRPQPAPETLGFRVLVSRVAESANDRDFFAGISMSPGTEARRMLHEPVPGALRDYSRMAQQRHMIDNLLRHISANAHDTRLWLGQVDGLIRDFDATSAGDVLFQLAAGLVANGKNAQAAEVLELLSRRFPDHDITPAALMWLLQYHASSEAAWQHERRARRKSAPPEPSVPAVYPVQPAGFFPGMAPGTALAPNVSVPNVIVQGSNATVDDGRDNFPFRAASYAQRILGAFPSLYGEPEIRFPCAANQRELGLAAEAERYYNAVAGSRVQDEWWCCARTESWLQQPLRNPLKPVLRCEATTEKPHLDGLLDDVAWRTATAVSLEVPDGGSPWPATVMTAYDEEFLYLAINCTKAEGVDYSTDESPRARDTDLAQRDRLSIQLDLDRDYVTAYRLTVDHRGWGNDGLMSAADWDPEWFIAALDDGKCWTIEAAISWNELTGNAPGKGTAWAIRLLRVLPGSGSQSWCGSASQRATPGQFGLLLFD